MSKKKKILLFILTILIFIIIPLISFTAYKIYTSYSTIKFLTSPKEVYVTIDNNKKQLVKSGDIIKVNPGKHTFKLSKNNFKTYTKTVTTTSNETYYISTILTGLTDDAINQAKKEATQEVKESWSGQQNTESDNYIQKNYPIYKILPVTDNSWYGISLCQSQKYPNDSNKKAVCISVYKTGGEVLAEQYIKDSGYKLSDYEVIVNNITTG